jgi:hypothetical protein
MNTVLKIINEKAPKYSYPVGKGTSIILTMQRFSYNVLESTVLKRVSAIAQKVTYIEVL